ncbi:MAG TPA: RagB/SusD family nutrient uptake outer membrane protein, partial [Mucilaginibacter sp.]|nr:RagB/SusD family nutrient uptake outer membrane protein [Mucilaginibacter sp.]
NNGLGSDFIDTFVPWDVPDDSVTGWNIPHSAENGWNIPTQDLLDAYETDDKRRAASVDETFTSDEYGVTMPFIKKYQSKATVQGITANNFPVYRYADVYLMLAECLNEQGFAGGGDAFRYLNLVRERAGLKDKTSGNVANQEDFRTAVAHERQIELSFENHRWFDLLRTGKATAVMTAHGAREKAIKKDLWTVNSAAYANIKLLFPYPLSQENLEH